MNKENILKFLKNRLGISTKARDDDLESVMESIIEELVINGVDITKSSNEISEFVIDCGYFRYNNRDAEELPRNLNRRLNNIIINYGKK